MKRFAVILSLVIACYLDSVFFQRFNIYGARPDALFAVVCSLGVLLGSAPAGGVGLAAGLLMDIWFNKIIGLGAACYMAAGIISGFFYRKFYADNFIVPAVTAAVGGFIKEMGMGIVLLILGARYNLALMTLQYILPCAVMTGGFCILAHLVLKPALTRWTKPGMDKNIGGFR